MTLQGRIVLSEEKTTSILGLYQLYFGQDSTGQSNTVLPEEQTFLSGIKHLYCRGLSGRKTVPPEDQDIHFFS
jgi:hypothetical protein